MKKQKIFSIVSIIGVVAASVALVVVVAIALTANSQGTKILGVADKDGQRLELPQP